MQDFLSFVADIMEVDASELSMETAYHVHPKWDSLMHMRLVMEIEDEYGVEIPIDEMADATTLASLYAYVAG